MSLASILKAASLDPSQCAGLFGVSPRTFHEWATGQRAVPLSYATPLSSALGVPLDELITPKKKEASSRGDILPAIWFKLRGEALTDADRECVLLIRLLGHQVNELEEVTARRLVGWKSIFREIRNEVDFQAPPREQGRQAARVLRTMRDLDRGKMGIGEVFRGNLRAAGILIVESPLPASEMEGCSFFVGSAPDERPCIFANTYQSTWFRRNVVLAHELAHAIFEGKNAGISLDFRAESDAHELSEERAAAFALEMLVPSDVLRHLMLSAGFDPTKLTGADVAWLVASTHVEQRAVILGLLTTDLISESLAEHYLSLDISKDLRSVSSHALSAKEFIKNVGTDADRWMGKRSTTVPSRSLRLPVPYIDAVLTAYAERKISRSRAAELLMIDAGDFEHRFLEYVERTEHD